MRGYQYGRFVLRLYRREEPVDPAALAFCNRAKTDKNVTGEDLTELKMALMDRKEDEACCDC